MIASFKVIINKSEYRKLDGVGYKDLVFTLSEKFPMHVSPPSLCGSRMDPREFPGESLKYGNVLLLTLFGKVWKRDVFCIIEPLPLFLSLVWEDPLKLNRK